MKHLFIKPDRRGVWNRFLYLFLGIVLISILLGFAVTSPVMADLPELSPGLLVSEPPPAILPSGGGIQSQNDMQALDQTIGTPRQSTHVQVGIMPGEVMGSILEPDANLPGGVSGLEEISSPVAVVNEGQNNTTHHYNQPLFRDNSPKMGIDNRKPNPYLSTQLNEKLLNAKAEALGSSFEEINVLKTKIESFPPNYAPLLQSKGNSNLLVFIIDFPDAPHKPFQTLEEAQIGFNGPGTTPGYYPPVDNLKSFYQRSSYNQLNLTADVYGWYQTEEERSYYEQMGWSGWSEIARECLNYYDSVVDYRKYDNNNDGIIDGIYLIYAGSQKSDFWWGYYGGLSLPDETWDGLSVRSGVISWYSNDGNSHFEPMVICHETGHLLGLPDYYDYDDSIGPKGGLGGFDMMDGNFVDHNCFSKYLLGWIQPTIISEGSHSTHILPSSESPDTFIVMPGTSLDSYSEYYMVQIRSPLSGNDQTWGWWSKKWIPWNEPGVVIWHIDSSLNDYGDFQNDNSYSEHKLIRLMEADGLEEIESAYSNWDPGDLYYSGSAFNQFTIPDSSRYDGTDTGIRIFDINFGNGGFFLNITIQNSLTIDTIVPSSAANTKPVDITITGTNFAVSPNTVRLTRSGQIPIIATNLVRVSSTQIRCTLPITGAASGDWTVELTTGGQTVSMPNGFRIVTPSSPSLTSISPSSGVNTGPISVTLTGARFAVSPNTVRLTRSGQSPIIATNLVRVSSTQIRCTLPITGSVSGDWTVELTTGGQTVSMPNGFRVVTSPGPSLTSISPSSGVNTGPVFVILTGSNFAASPNTVRLTRTGQSPITATNLVRASSTRITCTLPITGAVSGDWTVELTTGGQTATMPNGFQVVTPPPPLLTSLSQTSGVNTGSVSVTLTGSNFAVSPNTVRLTRTGQSPIIATNLVRDSSTQIRCTLPITGAVSGDWTVELTTGGQTVSMPNGFRVVTPSAPPLTSISPSIGVNTGPVSVILTGSNFAVSPNTVRLTRSGQSPIIATNLVRVSSTQIRCTLPITGAVSGDWTVELTTGGQTATMPNGFRVVTTTVPNITFISPSSGVNTAPVFFTLNGANFAVSPNTVRLTCSGQSPIIATNLVRASSTRITCTLPITGAVPGEWNVELTTGGQTVSMPKGWGFMVVTTPLPTLTSLSPSSGVNTGPVSVILTGSNFAVSPNTVRLTRSGQSPITATNLVRVSSTQIRCTLPITGSVSGDWTVELTTGGQTVRMLNGFRIVTPSAPNLESIFPSNGVNTGYVSVILTGSNFAVSPNTIRLTRTGQSPIIATNLVRDSPTQIWCTLPIAGAVSGDWNVELTTGGQTVSIPNGFRVVTTPSSALTSISPSIGVNTGPVFVTLTGSNFATSSNTVRLTRSGQSPIIATSLVRASSTRITCTLPITGAMSGDWNVELTSGGQTVTMRNGFRVVTAPAPTLSSISPSTAVNTGPVSVIITGSNFATSSNTVRLTRTGQSPITTTSLVRDSSTQIRCTLPITGSVSGDWNVELTSGGQTVSIPNGFRVVTTPAPTLTSITPSRGFNTGPKSVTLTGTNFAVSPNIVRLTRTGQSPITATNLVRDSSNQIRCTLPITGALIGYWNVELTTGGQTIAKQNGFRVDIYPIWH